MLQILLPVLGIVGSGASYSLAITCPNLDMIVWRAFRKSPRPRALGVGNF